MKNELKRKRTLKQAHKLADKAGIIMRGLITSIKNRQQKAA